MYFNQSHILDAISRISIVESILMNFKTTFFPMNLRCFFQDGILLAPRTLKQTIPIEFLEALPNNTALYWEPIVEFEIVFQKVIDSLIPFLKNSEHVLDLEYLQETFCSCIHERENLFNTKETYSIAEYSEEYVQLNEMLLKKSFLAAHRISQANAGTSYLETLYSEFGTMYHTSFIESAFMKDEGFQLLVRTNFLEDKHPGLVCLLPRPEFALLEKFWTRLYMLVCADKNFTEDNVQFVRRSFWPYYDKIDLFRCTLGFFYLLEHFLTLLCKFIFIASGNPNDTNGVDVFIKDQVLQYMAIFRADPEVQHEYSAGVSAELTKLVNIFEKMHHEKHYKGTKALVTNLSAHPLVRWWLQINRPASLVGEYCKLFLADIAQLLVKEENSGNKQLKFIQTGLFSYLASTLEDPPKVKQIVDNANQTDIPEDPTGDVGLDTGIKLLNKFNQDCDTWDQIFKPSSSAQLPKAKVKKNREEKKKLKREDAAKRAELEKQRTISKGQKPHRIDKPRQRKVRNFQVHGEKDLSINQGLNRSINPPDYQDIKSIEKNDSIISYIDRMLDLPSSDMPPSVEYFKEKKQATEFIQNMNKYFELL